MHSEQELPFKLSATLTKYLFILKETKRTEVYETLMLMLLSKNFLSTIEALIIKNLKTIKLKKKRLTFEIHSSTDYELAIVKICTSKYFNKNFTPPEIERRAIIAKNMIAEIALLIVMSFQEGHSNFNIVSEEVVFTTINHKKVTENNKQRIQLTFDVGTSLNNITEYFKDVLDIKNNPKKKKMSLGQSFRILQVEKEVRQNITHSQQKYEYLEQIIAREMLSKYKEKVSTDMISKSLQRIKKIQLEINTLVDK